MAICSAQLCAAQASEQPCATCHPKEVAGFAQSAMAHSVAPATGVVGEGRLEEVVTDLSEVADRVAAGADSVAAAYYRERCLTCHAATLPRDHAAPGRDCIGCHMQRLPAKDGGHTAFTDHRIARHPASPSDLAEGAMAAVKAWREPDPVVRDRNLALALTAHGMESSNSEEAILGYRMLNRLEPTLSNDPAALTVLGSVLLTAKQPREAETRFTRALALRPNYAPYEVNLASAFLAEGDPARAIPHLKQAVALDPFLAQAVQLLSDVYRQGGQPAKAGELTTQYRHAMGITPR